MQSNVVGFCLLQQLVQTLATTEREKLAAEINAAKSSWTAKVKIGTPSLSIFHGVTTSHNRLMTFLSYYYHYLFLGQSI
jgi:hypothetical protein